MSANEPPEHLHVLDSFHVGWRGVNLIYELEPYGEMPEAQFPYHFIAIALGNFRASYWLNGKWQHVDYSEGDIGILPATELFPRVQIEPAELYGANRVVPLLELFVDPQFVQNVIPAVQLAPHWNIRDPLIQQMGFALKTELETNGAAGSLYAESIAIALSAHLVRHYSSTPATFDVRGGLPQRTLRKILNYIHENLDQNLTIEHLSRVAQLSSHHFATRFKQSIGQTPHQYIMQCRIQRAKELLHNSNLTLVEIAHQVGFQNQSHFTRVFHQQVQITPKRYRHLT